MPLRRVRHHEIDDMIALTYDVAPKVRRRALRDLCPCHVRANQPTVWDRILAMADDPDVGVRGWVVHAMADGAPHELEPQVISTL